MRPNDRVDWCCMCGVQLAKMEGRILKDQGFFRTFCRLHGAELLEARAARRLQKKNSGTDPML